MYYYTIAFCMSSYAFPVLFNLIRKRFESPNAHYKLDVCGCVRVNLRICVCDRLHIHPNLHTYSLRARARVCVCVCVRACPRACVPAYVRVCVRAGESVSARVLCFSVSYILLCMTKYV